MLKLKRAFSIFFAVPAMCILLIATAVCAAPPAAKTAVAIRSVKILPVGQKVILHKYTTAQFPIFGGWYDPYQEIVGHRYTVLGSTTYVVDGVTYVVYALEPYLTTDPGVFWPESALTLAFGGGISKTL